MSEYIVSISFLQRRLRQFGTHGKIDEDGVIGLCNLTGTGEYRARNRK